MKTLHPLISILHSQRTRLRRAESGARWLVRALAALSCLAAWAGAADMRVGVAAVDITPPLGIPMAGYYHARGADGVLDPLYSKAMVIESDGERVALVALDIIGITRAITDQARAQRAPTRRPICSSSEKILGRTGARLSLTSTPAAASALTAGRTREMASLR